MITFYFVMQSIVVNSLRTCFAIDHCWAVLANQCRRPELPPFERELEHRQAHAAQVQGGKQTRTRHLGTRGDGRARATAPVALRVRALPEHQTPRARKLGARPRQTQCPSRAVDPLGGAIPGYGEAAGGRLNFRLICLFLGIKLASRPRQICVSSY